MRIEIEIERSCPGEGQAARFQSFHVEVPRHATVLDTLMAVKNQEDGSVTFRRSCRSAICGSCAMRINGRSGLACDTQVEGELRRHGKLRIQPLAHMPVVRDLAVEIDPFWARVRAVQPWVERPREAEPSWPVEQETRMPQSAAEEMDDTSKCIMCMSCFSACEVAEVDTRFLGPAALAKAYRFVADPRDTNTQNRLATLNGGGGYWDCTRCNQCVEACPKDVKPMEAIVHLRREAIRAGFTGTIGSRHITDFLSIVRQEGRLNEGRMPMQMKGFNPFKLLPVLPLAWRMWRKGKLPLPWHWPIPGVSQVRRIMDRKGGARRKSFVVGKGDLK
ncbi:MAG: succinate dehydrogenase iron-sulfur subunit [Nitrospirota bacterium]|nr:succinate dehydrogenase iron-sulfur subunit [Nitrospirota bacterium]